MIDPGDASTPRSAQVAPPATAAAVPTAAPTPTAHGQATYEPQAATRGIALCLSGGGFRAALFHLGAVRCLNDLGVLSKVDTISSVSGGSILAAHLAARVRPWPVYGARFPDWEERVAAPFRAFTARNLRTGPLLRRLLPWNWCRSSTAVEALAARYIQDLTPLRLRELPDRPKFVFCATDMAFGVDWTFEKERVGNYEAGYARPGPKNWRVGRAVAASSCFPPVFDPLPIRLRPDQLKDGQAAALPNRDAVIRGLRLSDGGVYDNMGLEAVWETHAHILVSDGGGVFDPDWDRGPLWRLTRYAGIQGNQVTTVRKRWLISNFLDGKLHGAYWGIGSVTTHYGPDAPAGYSEDLVRQTIAEVRTDMDSFSAGEQAALENHGYLMAAAAILQHERPLVVDSVPAPAALRPPHPLWMDETRVAAALADSHRIQLLGR